MAGDEKHARELIAKATAHIEYTLSSIGPEGSEVRAAWRRGEGSDERFALLVELRNALEAALPGDDDWEWGYELRDANGNAHCRGWEFATAEEARVFGQRRAAEENERWAEDPDHTQTFVCVVVRRRLAGPWEPVEEVPLG